MKLFIVLALVAVAAADKLPAVRTAYGSPAEVRSAPEATARILEMENNHGDDGSYSFRFSSDDGIARQEERSSYGAVTGSYTYETPEGAVITVTYVADENGYRAESDALPTPPPTQYPTPSVPSTEAPIPVARSGYGAPAAREAPPQPRQSYGYSA